MKDGIIDETVFKCWLVGNIKEIREKCNVPESFYYDTENMFFAEIEGDGGIDIVTMDRLEWLQMNSEPKEVEKMGYRTIDDIPFGYYDYRNG